MSDDGDSLPRLLGTRYRLEARLGSGGMGVVYRATDLTMHRAVAVKVVRGADGVELDEAIAGRFRREAKHTARIQHENIIEVYDLGRADDGDMFFVMELLEGESLSAKLQREGKLAMATSVHIAAQMCAALDVVHTAGIIHRDLKPANVMLIDRAGQGDYVKVLDFGVAKSYAPDQQTELTHTGMLVGTVEYMAPEQIMGGTVDGRTDIYALGVLMYRMLTGKAPFREGGVPALIHAHLHLFPKPMGELAAELPGALDRVVLRCLAKQPSQRFDSMGEVARALASAIEVPHESLPNFDFARDEIYDKGDQTEVLRPVALSRPPLPRPPSARPPLPRPPSIRPPLSRPPLSRPLLSRPPSGRPPNGSRRDLPQQHSAEDPYDDATIKLDRRESRSNEPLAHGGLGPEIAAQRLLHASRSTPPGDMPALSSADADVDPFDRTALMSSDESTAKRSVSEALASFERAGPRECAMCRTTNPPHARACNACGVSLARENQEALRERMTAPPPGPREASLAPLRVRYDPATGRPLAPPQNEAPRFAEAPRPHAFDPRGLVGAPPQVLPQGAHPHGPDWGPASTHRSPPTAWQRLLAWIGLRGS